MKLSEIFYEPPIRILLENLNLDTNGYGCWLNSNTGESFKVPYTDHMGAMRRYVDSRGIDTGEEHISDWACNNGWIRMTFDTHQEIKIECEKSSLTRIWKELLPIIREYLDVNLTILENGQTLLHDTFETDDKTMYKLTKMLGGT